jgi:WD40 repeat protein
VSVSPDGSRLCAAAQPLLAGIWPLERLADPAELSPTPAAEEGHLAWLADGSLVGIPYRERQSLYRFRARGRGYASELLVGRRPTSGENEFDFANTERDMAQGWYTRVAVSATGHRLALEVGGGQRSVEVWTPDPLNRLLSVEIDEGIRKATARDRLLALSGDGTRLLLAHEDSGYLVWSVDTDARIEAPTLALGHCHLGAWAPQGSRFAVAHESSITVVNSDSTADPVELVGHAARVLSLAFCPRGERLVSGGQDGSLRVWNARTGAELRRLDVSSGCAVTAVCFTADGESVISGSTDSYVRIWRLWPLEELQVLAKQRGIVLSEESRRRFGLSA